MKTFIALTFLILIFCCFPSRSISQNYTYPIINEPTTVEGRKCVIECKKIKLLELELYEKQNQYRSNDSRRQRKVEAEFWQIEPRYDKCILDCGGKEEKIEK